METVHIGTLEYITARSIAVPHCFTTRRGGVSTGIFSSMNIAFKEGDTRENIRKNLQILADSLGFHLENLICTHQTHSDTVRVVSMADRKGCFHREYPDCDALVTNEPGVALMVYTADCTPILLFDPVTGAVGAVHAGWRGTAADIAGKAVRTMAAQFGCDPKNIRAAIGPNIGGCCFATDAEVPEAMISALGRCALNFIRTRGGKYYVDLKAINAQLLKSAGITQIDISSDCTMCQPDRFWSHRYTKGRRGSQGAIIVCKEASL